jgi:hypothetical protein
MANRRGANKTLYMLAEVRDALALAAEANSTSESAIVADALRDWFKAHPVPPDRAALVEQRRAAEQALKSKRVEEMGIEPRAGVRRPVALAMATRRRAA